jgi:hypothetical protein
VKIRRGVGKGYCFLKILFNWHSQYVMERDLEGFGDFEVGGQVNTQMKLCYWLRKNRCYLG